MKISIQARMLGVMLLGLHLIVFFAGFFAPYETSLQNRDLPFAPPAHIHFLDIQGKIHPRPLVCVLVERSDAFAEYFEDRGHCFPVRFLVRGAPYKLFGLMRSNVHLFGVDAPATIFLMGTDAYGRDVFSRFLYGGQISLFAGLIATVLTLVLGALLGTLAGYYGGWLDAGIMRGAELFLALPWLYFLIAVRAFLPLSLSPKDAFVMLIAVIGFVGWARPARLIRAVVLSSREHHYVLAARLFGASDMYLMRRHILPDTYSILLTQAVLLIPQYVLAEVTLSFLGLGAGEPTPSWGSMLSTLQQYSVLVSYWWMLIPGLVLVPVFFGYVLLASELQSGRKTAAS
ncbi:MAG TPA: ABC transporter permease [Candidatus Sulfotelmatobacter sp.]|jgi:peptide/nickel transport system permease protein